MSDFPPDVIADLAESDFEAWLRDPQQTRQILRQAARDARTLAAARDAIRAAHDAERVLTGTRLAMMADPDAARLVVKLKAAVQELAAAAGLWRDPAPSCTRCGSTRDAHCDLDEPGVDHAAGCDKMHHEFVPQT